jgi:hypothetical protein
MFMATEDAPPPKNRQITIVVNLALLHRGEGKSGR